MLIDIITTDFQNEKHIYKDLYAGLKNCDSVINTITVLNPDKVMNKIFAAIMADNPYIYYVDQTQIVYQVFSDKMEIRPVYVFSKSEIVDLNKRFQNKANEILNEVINSSAANDLSRETALYEYFTRNFSYNKAVLKSNDLRTISKAHSLLGVFLEGQAVCEGFSKAFKFLMNAMDIKCIVVSGFANWDYASAHAWNIVKINNRPYHVDVTWAVSGNEKGAIWYDYLNISDKVISADHNGFSGVPKCIHDDLDYYINVAPQIDNTIYLKNHIKECLLNRKSLTTFKLLKGKEKHGIKDLNNSNGFHLITDAARRAQVEANGIAFKMNMLERKERNNYMVFFEYD